MELIYNESILSLTEGITATSAQHMCNLAKETYAEIEERHKKIRFYNKKIESLHSDPKVLLRGQDNSYLDTLKQDLVVLHHLKAFIAYFKEAIKMKEKIYSEYTSKHYDVSTYSDKFGRRPLSPVKDTLNDAIERMPIAKKQQYLDLETKCAVYGSFVHPDGALSKARKTVMNVLNEPTTVDSNNQDTLITTYEASIDLVEVDDLFFEIQKGHRRCQAELNKIKSDLEESIDTDYQTRYSAFLKELNKWNSGFDEETDKFNAEKDKVLSQIQKLKIIIPDKLQDIYKKLSSK
jgi:hypothetical protein